MQATERPILDRSIERNIEIHNLESSSEVESKYQAIENEGFQVIYDVICISETFKKTPCVDIAMRHSIGKEKHSHAPQLNCA